MNYCIFVCLLAWIFCSFGHKFEFIHHRVFSAPLWLCYVYPCVYVTYPCNCALIRLFWRAFWLAELHLHFRSYVRFLSPTLWSQVGSSPFQCCIMNFLASNSPLMTLLQLATALLSTSYHFFPVFKWAISFLRCAVSLYLPPWTESNCVKSKILLLRAMESIKKIRNERVLLLVWSCLKLAKTSEISKSFWLVTKWEYMDFRPPFKRADSVMTARIFSETSAVASCRTFLSHY